MRFSAFGVELVIDELEAEEFPSELPRKQIRFVTSLVNIDVNLLPDSLPKIYTSESLKSQLKLLSLSRENVVKELDEANFHVLKPYEVERIQVSDEVHFEVLPCMPADMSTSFMLVFRKVQSLRITHLYAGYATDLGSIMANTTFAIWLKASGGSIDNLYLLSTRHGRCADCELERTFEDIQEKLSDENIAKLLVHLPLFGCEPFIAKLASEYRGIVAIDGLLCDLFSVLPNAKMQYFTKDFEESVIVVSKKNLPLDPDCPYKVSLQTFKVKWLPLPDAYELKLLTRTVVPKSIEIIDNNKIMQTFSIHIVKYAYETDESTGANNTSITNTTSTKSSLCYCSKVGTPMQLPPVKHSNLEDCMQRLVFAHTDQFQNIEPELTVEDELEKIFRTSSRSMDVENTPETSGVPDEPSAANRNSAATTKSALDKLPNEQPSTSRVIKNTKETTGSTAEKQTPKSKSTYVSPIIYHQGQRGLCFEDSSSSD